MAREHGTEQEEEDVSKHREHLRKIRDESYQDPTPPFHRCEKCAHCWEFENSESYSYECRLVRGFPKQVDPAGVCAKFEDKG